MIYLIACTSTVLICMHSHVNTSYLLPKCKQKIMKVTEKKSGTEKLRNVKIK